MKKEMWSGGCKKEKKEGVPGETGEGSEKLFFIAVLCYFFKYPPKKQHPYFLTTPHKLNPFFRQSIKK